MVATAENQPGKEADEAFGLAARNHSILRQEGNGDRTNEEIHSRRRNHQGDQIDVACKRCGGGPAVYGSGFVDHLTRCDSQEAKKRRDELANLRKLWK